MQKLTFCYFVSYYSQRRSPDLVFVRRSSTVFMALWRSVILVLESTNRWNAMMDCCASFLIDFPHSTGGALLVELLVLQY